MSRQKILLLHGALGAASQLEALAEKLSGNFDALCINFPGHGGRAIPDSSFSFPAMGKDIIGFLDEQGIPKIDMFGYSMGGYAALWLARNFPERAGRIFTLATKFEWNEDIAKREASMLNPAKMMEKIPDFVNVLQERHGADRWKTVVAKTAEMMLDLAVSRLSDADLNRIQPPVRITVGEKDNMVSREESKHAADLLPNGSFHVFPETPHPFERIDLNTLSNEMNRFFRHEAL